MFLYTRALGFQVPHFHIHPTGSGHGARRRGLCDTGDAWKLVLAWTKRGFFVPFPKSQTSRPHRAAEGQACNPEGGTWGQETKTERTPPGKQMQGTGEDGWDLILLWVW